MRKKLLSVVTILSLLLASCSSNNNAENSSDDKSINSSTTQQVESSDKEVIYTSFYPIYSLTSQIAGDKFEVKSFGNLTSEAHDWEPSAKDIAKLEDSKLLIINGAGMEEWLDDVKNSTDIEILDTTKNVDLIKAEDHDEDEHEAEEGEEHHHHHGEYDPHTWLSPMNAKIQAKAIYEKLSEIDNENASYYKNNYENLDKELDSIIKEYKEKLDNIDDKKIVVNHEAFGYLSRDFSLEQISLTGLTSTGEANLKAMNEIIDEIKDEKINTVFYEKGGSDKSAKVIAEQINGDVKPLSTMEFVSDDDLKNDVKYQDLIKENLQNIYESLQ
ncbi:MAG: zinc ABC transporter substrate-binding protein [Tissierellia bacterium]|nr:zinc ABC transporter substrate-binding protein [Tissierellia bacterium]